MSQPPPDPAPVLVEVTVAADEADVASGALWAAGAVAVEELAAPDGRVTLRTTPADPADLDALVTTAAALGEVRTAEVPADAGLDAWRDHARPWRAGRHLVVWPAWLEHPGDHGDLCRTDDLVIVVDPGRAFGSGAHASTRVALAALEQVVAPGDAVLDVGCGSGVLAVACVRLGARSAVGIDIDPAARQATVANAERAGVGDAVTVADGTLDDVDTTFDVVVANVLAVTVRQLAPALATAVAPGGRLVLAGLLDDQVPDVLAHVPQLEIVDRASIEGWAGLTLAAPGAS